jgi:hypothetical protein
MEFTLDDNSKIATGEAAVSAKKLAAQAGQR